MSRSLESHRRRFEPHEWQRLLKMSALYAHRFSARVFNGHECITKTGEEILHITLARISEEHDGYSFKDGDILFFHFLCRCCRKTVLTLPHGDLGDGSNAVLPTEDEDDTPVVLTEKAAVAFLERRACLEQFQLLIKDKKLKGKLRAYGTGFHKYGLEDWEAERIAKDFRVTPATVEQVPLAAERIPRGIRTPARAAQPSLTVVSARLSRRSRAFFHRRRCQTRRVRTMSNMQDRIDVLAEIRACESIRAFDEARLDLELTRMGLDAAGLPQRLEVLLGPAARAGAGGSDAKGADAVAMQPPAPAAIAGTPVQSAAPAAAMASAPPLKPFEIAGRMKFFDPSKYYGFFVADGDQGDVMVHISCLRAAGYQTAHEGARIHAVVHRTPKGLQALQILSMDESTAVHPSQLPQRTREKVQAQSDWVRAVVKWYNRERGYGFVWEGEGMPDVFVHADVLRRWGVAPLWAAQVVEMRWGMSSRGRMVAEIRYIGGISGLPPVH